jgi:hypothetical protein
MLFLKAMEISSNFIENQFRFYKNAKFRETVWKIIRPMIIIGSLFGHIFKSVDLSIAFILLRRMQQALQLLTAAHK